MNETKVCVLCGKEFVGYGNNPKPLAQSCRCCDDCDKQVTAARYRQLVDSKRGRDDAKEESN